MENNDEYKFNHIEETINQIGTPQEINEIEYDETCERSTNPEGTYNTVLDRCMSDIIDIVRRYLSETPT